MMTAAISSWMGRAGNRCAHVHHLQRRCANASLSVYLFVRHGIRVLSIQLGPVFGGLATAGVFLLIAVVGADASALARDRTRQRATLERAARAQGTMALIDPKVLSVAMQAGRALGWQRLIPLALLGFLAAQWMQEARREDTPDRTI